MKINKTYTETEYNILNAKYERLAINLNNIIIEEKKKSNFIINELETQIKELKTPLYIKLIKGSYDYLFFIFLGITFLYFFFHFITL
jgi:archaellum component FlaC